MEHSACRIPPPISSLSHVPSIYERGIRDVGNLSLELMVMVICGGERAGWVVMMMICEMVLCLTVEIGVVDGVG